MYYDLFEYNCIRTYENRGNIFTLIILSSFLESYIQSILRTWYSMLLYYISEAESMLKFENSLFIKMALRVAWEGPGKLRAAIERVMGKAGMGKGRQLETEGND